ncbi:MAG: endopeptidase La [Myxococcales bacterium]|nr:endopeptidase La [Myxococcales bacterium]MCB9708328.1 endopeptidase La [Myxococcales bacterium]
MFFSKTPTLSGDPVSPVLPVLPLRDIVVFPHMVVPLFVGREKSIHALEHAMNGSKEVVFSAQKKAQVNDPGPDEIFETGCLGSILQLLRLPDGTVKVLVEGKRRVAIRRFVSNDKFFLCEIADLIEDSKPSLEIAALVRSVHVAFEAYTRLNKRFPTESLLAIQAIEDPSNLADSVVIHLNNIKLHDRQAILELVDVPQRLDRVFQLLIAETEILQVEKKIRSRVKRQMEKTQKEYYLNEQMQAIQKELGERDEFRAELEELDEKLQAKALPQEAQTKIKREIKKLKMMQPMSAEATVIRHYIDWVLALPWSEKSQESYDLEAAHAVLEQDHFGLSRIKDRILEHLAVRSLVKKIRGPVLCLVGPPGVGKTSLARSIARATGRQFVRLSLGGVRDEAEIRGHRRTYIGAMPGRIIQSLRKAGANNPVFLLDEVDKMSADFRGDPAAALLEVLDPEQNHSFSDHYLDLDYDLSDVMFITTANSLHGIPLPLQDRMEIIQLSSYTEFEKLNIATRYLIPRQKSGAGLDGRSVEISENAIRHIIHHYTKESGVRNLEREIGGLFRKIAREIVSDKHVKRSYRVTAKHLNKYLGVPKFREGKAHDLDEIGLTNGLAYTSYGGAILECEVAVVAGKGKVVITGLVEKGMQESAHAALSYVRSRHRIFGLEEDFYQDADIHIHFPEFVPKDGPSAGITMATSITSAFTKIPVKRSIAMTGEITLRGKVIPIGGLKEKLLAAHRAEIQTVIIPKDNLKDLRDIPKRIIAACTIVLVEHMDEVLMEALRLSDPAAVFGPRHAPARLIEGKMMRAAPTALGAVSPKSHNIDAPDLRQ